MLGKTRPENLEKILLIFLLSFLGGGVFFPSTVCLIVWSFEFAFVLFNRLTPRITKHGVQQRILQVQLWLFQPWNQRNSLTSKQNMLISFHSKWHFLHISVPWRLYYFASLSPIFFIIFSLSFRNLDLSSRLYIQFLTRNPIFGSEMSNSSLQMPMFTKN